MYMCVGKAKLHSLLNARLSANRDKSIPWSLLEATTRGAELFWMSLLHSFGNSFFSGCYSDALTAMFYNT